MAARSKSTNSTSAGVIRIKIPTGLSCPRLLRVRAKLPEQETTYDEESFCRTPASTKLSSTLPLKLSASLLKKLTKVQSIFAGIGAGGNFIATSCNTALFFHSPYRDAVYTMPLLENLGLPLPIPLPCSQSSINSVSSQIFGL